MHAAAATAAHAAFHWTAVSTHSAKLYTALTAKANMPQGLQAEARDNKNQKSIPNGLVRSDGELYISHVCLYPFSCVQYACGQAHAAIFSAGLT